MNVEAIRRTYCAPSVCTILLGHHWDGSRWWEDGEVYQGMRLSCMRGRGPDAPRPVAYVPPPTPVGAADVFDRARRYVERMPPALAGSGGSTATFKVAVTLVRGFALPPDDALAILVDYNARCVPPWSMHELRHKIRQALKAKLPAGYLRERSAKR